jgi:hypothetical protein
MVRPVSVITIGFAVCLLTACGTSTFGGSSANRSGASKQGATKTDDTNKDLGKNDDSIADPSKKPSKEHEAIGKCMAAWGSDNPFGDKAYTEYRKISATVNILGNGGYAVEDRETTTKPKLILVSASVSVLGSANYLLMNPNGWYCFMVDVNVLSKVNVDLQCNAKLADTRVAVNVLSKASSTAAVGVNVMSSVTVNRMEDETSKDSCN